MDKFDRLMRQIVDIIDGTWLSKRDHPALTDRGPIAGCSNDEIEQTEVQIAKRLPAAMQAWYRAAGKVPPYLYDYDADYSLDDLVRSQRTAQHLSQEEGCEWQLPKTAIPFSQRIGEQFLFVDTISGNTDDPPVFHFMEGSSSALKTDIAFSTHIREVWLRWLNFPVWSRDHRQEIATWREKGYRDWLSRKRVIDELEAETIAFRDQLIESIHQEDLLKDEITSPADFQRRWIEAFSTSETWLKLQGAGLRFPYNWITPPA